MGGVLILETLVLSSMDALSFLGTLVMIYTASVVAWMQRQAAYAMLMFAIVRRTHEVARYVNRHGVLMLHVYPDCANFGWQFEEYAVQCGLDDDPDTDVT